MAFLYSVVGFLIAIAILVAVHEFGHYWVAKKLGVKVLAFSIGFGKPIFSKKSGADNTEYILASIPLGGYVKMLDENEGNVAKSEKHRAFNRQPIWKRTCIVAAGPLINFLFAILVFILLGISPVESLKPTLGEVPEQSVAAKSGIKPGDKLLSIDGRDYKYFDQHNLYLFNQVLKKKPITFVIENDVAGAHEVIVNTADISIRKLSPNFLMQTMGLMPYLPKLATELNLVVEGSPAEQAGLRKGDKIIEIDGQQVDAWAQLVELISAAPNKPTLLAVERDGAVMSFTITPEKIEKDGKTIGRIGVSPMVPEIPEAYKTHYQRNIVQSIGYGFEQTWLMSSVTVRMLGKMLIREASPKNISGPITIAEYTGKAIQIGLDYYLYLLAVISISLGVMNLLPIPMLDGGHLLFYLFEAVAGKPLSERWMQYGQQLGLLLLFGLMSLAFYNDIFRLMN